MLDAGAELASSLDYRKTLAAVARLAVSEIADWCTVHVVEEDGSIRELEIAHTDPGKVVFVRELQERYPPRPGTPSGPARVIESGRSELQAEIPDELLAAAAVDEIHLDLIRQLGLASYMCVPLTARERVLGAITLAAAESGRRFDEVDLRLAEELGRRAGTAIENAELFRELQERAQASMVLASIADGVVLVDGEGAIRLWNEAAAVITGVPAATARGRPLAAVLPGWPQVEPLVAVADVSDARPESVPLDARRQGALALDRRRPGRGRSRLRLPRPDRGTGGRAAPLRLRRDGLARAADAAGRDLRRRRDAAPTRHRARRRRARRGS